MILFYFLFWTFTLYWIHRIAHNIKAFEKYHYDHHYYISNKGSNGWHWNNLFLFNDTWKSTIDLWITEVIPTLVFSFFTNQWWIFIFYYFWAALVQEIIEHNQKFNLYPFLTSGKWHLIHHQDSNKNFGLFFPIWDILFNTYEYDIY